MRVVSSPLGGAGPASLRDGAQVDHESATYDFQSLSAGSHLETAFSDYVRNTGAKVLSRVMM